MSEIEGIDPLTTGQVMYPAAEPPIRAQAEPIYNQPEVFNTPLASVHKTANSSKSEQDEVAKGREEKPVRAKIKK